MHTLIERRFRIRVEVESREIMLSSHDSVCSAFNKVNIATTNAIKTPQTSPKAFGLETKQLRDPIRSLRSLFICVREVISS